MTIDRDWLRGKYEVMVGAYTYPEKAGEFAAWETWLDQFPQWALDAVFFNAVDVWPEKMPTVGMIRKAVIEAMQKRRNAERREQPRPDPEGPIATHMQPGFRKMAANIERESLRLGLDPEQQAPHEIEMRRIRSIRALFGKHSKIETLNGEDVVLQTNPRDKKRRPPA